MNSNMVLWAGLSVIVVGMALIFVGVISPALFYPGIYLIAIGMMVTAVAGVLHVIGRRAA